MNSTLANLPATRWDRLVAVLEENEPERAIEAPHILERAKKLNLSDLELFHLLLMRYQDKKPAILMDVVSLYAMMSTWMGWIVQVQRCLSAKKGKMETRSPSRSVVAVPMPLQTPFDLTDTGHGLHSRSSSNYMNTPVSLNTTGSAGGFGNDSGSRPNSATRAPHNSVSPSMRGPRGKSGRGSRSASLHWRFDLGPDWRWDGSLDFLRNGRVLSCLVEEALDHCGKLEVLQDDHRAHPEKLNPCTYEILYPSLADIDRVLKASVGDAANRGACANGTFDPLNYLSSFDSSRLGCSRRGNVPPSKALKMIEEQGKSLAEAEQWVRKLNGMCEHFLGWEKAAHNNCAFFDLCKPDNLVRPLNSDDARLLYRMHWLAVALYRTVKDPSIIPAPPRMSFIVCHDDLSEVLSRSEEDNEVGLLVATRCSCLPLKARLSVTMQNFNTMQLFHPDMKHGPRVLPCTIVKGEVFAYCKKYHAFIPLWSVFQYYIQRLDGMTWCFEMNQKEREQERQVLATNAPATCMDLGASGDLTISSSGAAFDLTVRHSTVRHDRQCRPPEAPSNNPQMRGTAPPDLYGTPTDDKGSVKLLPPRFINRSAAQTGTGAETGVAVSKVRRNRIATLSPRSTAAPQSSSSSPATTPRADGTPTKQLALPADAAGIMNKANGTSNTARTPTTADTSASSLGADADLNAVKNLISDLSLQKPISRQVTALRATGESETQSANIAPGLLLEPTNEGRDESAENSEPFLGESAPDMSRKGSEVAQRDFFAGTSANDAMLMSPSCTISCSPSSQAIVARAAHFYCGTDAPDEDDEMITDATLTMRGSESHMVIRNFTASVLQESEKSGIAIFSHHFRVSSGPIGKGAFGAVYKALNLDTGRIVAVKQSRYSYDEKTTDLNWREFQMWSMLPPHANVITFYGASREVDTHQLLLVMEYASGGSIVQLYRNFRPIPEPLFYNHALGMARGLKHLHDHNVIHGDVKPENVLTRSDGSVAISDFGCSRFSLVGSDSDSSSVGTCKRESNSLQLFGTAAYMAPEVILNEPHLKSDVWAYACTLLQLWLGEVPWSDGERCFSAMDSVPLMFYIANEEVVPFSAGQLERTPRWLQRIARRAFEREVEQRCNMAEIISILTEYSRAYCS
ncbi:hypothetical protein LSCM1_01720 [Leishmania martiniquensis]|uniref:Protein kinase domain-containing protein n=1 Tax=Leishmania martiniquensis TaxID=1580590 RepID=A0A836G956_9TRYP|nr:hypothetical protein LSCM1_01720 [Leishmania martiniquensis]